MERIYTIPLRKVFRAPRTKRAKKAITLIREFLKRHMKCEEIVIGKSLNETIWARGIQKPPRKVRIHALKHDGKVYAELLGVDIKLPEKKKVEKEVKKEEKESKVSEEEEKTEKKEEKVEEVKEEKSKEEAQIKKTKKVGKAKKKEEENKKEEKNSESENANEGKKV